MEKYRNKGIKDIIAEFPQVGEILDEYGIGCGPCSVGICQLKDILDIHKMAPEKEQEVMARIEAVIYPERERGTCFSLEKGESAGASYVFSAPMQLLVNEHVVIKRWLALIPSVIENIDLATDEGIQIVEDGIDLIRSYADRLHHGKEEDILFTYFDVSEKIFQVICEDHRNARNHVRNMVGALEVKDVSSLAEHLTAYGTLLAEHIKKEDEILFPWLDSKLTSDQLVELGDKFAMEDRSIGVDPDKYQSFLKSLEDRYGR
ncbi:MAG: hemerythrin domain-containing protein [Desulforhopalus sp.]